jgi:ABC-2 type transport system permease protein
MTRFLVAIGAVPTVFRVGLANAIVYPMHVLISILSTSTSLVMLAFWSAVSREGAMGRFGQTQFTAYFLVSATMRMLTSSYVIREMSREIRQGTLATRLLRPLHPFLAYATNNLASLPLRALVSTPLIVLILVFVGPQGLTSDPWLWMTTAVALLGAWVLNVSVMLAVGSLGLYWDSSEAVWEIWFGLAVVFSGHLLPLDLFPNWLGQVVRRTPFPYVLAFPVETLLGLSSRAQALTNLATQWGYAAAFLGLALVWWRRGLARFEAHGG